MSQRKKNEPQFKLNYFDIIKGVLFPNMGKPTLKAPLPSAQKPAQTAYPPAPASSGQRNPQRPTPLPASQATPQKPAQTEHAPLVSPIQGDTPRPATRPASPPPTSSSGMAGGPPARTMVPQRPAQKPTARPGGLTLRRDKLGAAFFNVAGILSFIVNIVLIVVLIILARELFALKALVGDHLLGGLYENFKLMDAAHIRTNITVEDSIPIQFDLPIDQAILVTLNEPTRINGAQVAINSGGLSINAPANIVLPAGTQLPIQLNLIVPVQTTVPIKINVPVDIPLQQTELHPPFLGLQDVVRPLNDLLQPNIKTPQDLPCGIMQPACNTFFITP